MDILEKLRRRLTTNDLSKGYSVDELENKRVFDIEIIENILDCYTENYQGTLVLHENRIQGIVEYGDSGEKFFIMGIYIPEKECELTLLTDRPNSLNCMMVKAVDTSKWLNKPDRDKQIGKYYYKELDPNAFIKGFSGSVEILFHEKEYTKPIDKAKAIAEIESKSEDISNMFNYGKSLLEQEEKCKSLLKKYEIN